MRPRRHPRALPSGDRDHVLAAEVLHLHSLWRQGPPVPASVPAPNPPCDSGGSRATRHRADRRKRRRLELLAQPHDIGSDWPLAPSPPASPATWPDASEQPQPPPPSPGSLAQRAALRAAEEFIAGHASDDDDEGSESEGEDSGDEGAAGFFLGLFERDVALRGYYERSWEDGEFMCMACVGRKIRRGRARRFRGCVGLVQHARAATRCGRPRAHRALAAAVCRVLAWDIDRLPSVVIDPRGTLGQALATVAAPHEGKEDGPWKSSSLSVNNGQVHVQKNNEESFEKVNNEESFEKENIEDVNPLSSKDTSKNEELCKAVQEEEDAVDNKQEHAKIEDVTRDNDIIRLGSNSSKEEAVKERSKHIIDTVDHVIASLGNNSMDLPKS